MVCRRRNLGALEEGRLERVGHFLSDLLNLRGLRVLACFELLSLGYGRATPAGAASYAGLDAFILLRTTGTTELANFVLGGGLLITEWSASQWALNTVNLLNADDTGGGGPANGALIVGSRSGSSWRPGRP